LVSTVVVENARVEVPKPGASTTGPFEPPWKRIRRSSASSAVLKKSVLDTGIRRGRSALVMVFLPGDGLLWQQAGDLGSADSRLLRHRIPGVDNTWIPTIAPGVSLGGPEPVVVQLVFGTGRLPAGILLPGTSLTGSDRSPTSGML
jgi:hypothetical protein